MILTVYTCVGEKSIGRRLVYSSSNQLGFYYRIIFVFCWTFYDGIVVALLIVETSL